MTENTVCIKRRSTAGSTSSFVIEVPPHLAKDLGLCVLTPLTSRTIECRRVSRRKAA
jgi:hypothetical protein